MSTKRDPVLLSERVDSKQRATRPTTPLRFITAASLFDGHDAAINIIRRILIAQGAEVIHLGHNRSVADIVRAAIQEDADGIAVSSYQGGHNEYFRYMVDCLRQADAEHIRVVVGGGGTIAPDEIAALEKYGVEKIYTPDDGLALGLEGMIQDVFTRTRQHAIARHLPKELDRLNCDDHQGIAQALTQLELETDPDAAAKKITANKSGSLVLGITGTGGAGKSSLSDELIGRFVRQYPGIHIAVLAVDPTRRRTGGALLGDRIRMNALSHNTIYMRSFATRRQHQSTSAVVKPAIALLKSVGFDLIIVETAGIGQSDSAIVDLVDLSLYVMTSEFGASSQLEKIDMLDLAEVIAINKFDKRGSPDALRDVRKQWKRNHVAFKASDEQVPVFPTMASRFNDPGVNRLFAWLCQEIQKKSKAKIWAVLPSNDSRQMTNTALIPNDKERYLAEIASSGRKERQSIEEAAQIVSCAYTCYESLRQLNDPLLPKEVEPYSTSNLHDKQFAYRELRALYNQALKEVGESYRALLRGFSERIAAVRADKYSYTVREQRFEGENYTTSLSQLKIPKIAVPKYRDWGDQLRFLANENFPGDYPYTAGVYPYRRTQEDPARMFAGEGTPERTNRRFHLLANGHPATRLSTAFDSVTLYGENPDERPDIYGRIGNSGVSVATLDDMKKLYSGFHLINPNTSVSMTINGPAPMILAMFFNAAIDQEIERYLKESGKWENVQKTIRKSWGNDPPSYNNELPAGRDHSGLGLLGISGDQLVDADTYAKIKAQVLKTVRGTVQADILKEDQAQNTCIFSTEFALRLMGDIQEYFTQQQVRNFYSVSVSGYHIAEAGANPISQLAFTLANGFTLVEYYLHRGLAIDDFAPNLSFFFSNGMDPEYAVIGRVARRIWARAMKHRYGASARSQMLKYHIQTSGRSLHAQEIQFNDIRTTLQALYALFDNCNSLHTNAYDEAITTPTEESVRRALAIQLIINKELGLNKTENPWQGSFIIEELTDLVEEAVYQEFERISERGGVLGAMESMYQRSKIQEESLYYERQKMSGELPIVGVNTFRPDEAREHAPALLIRSTEEEKQQQVKSLQRFHQHHVKEAEKSLASLSRVASEGGNVFAELMEAVKHCSLGQISETLYRVGGQYRRAM